MSSRFRSALHETGRLAGCDQLLLAEAGPDRSSASSDEQNEMQYRPVCILSQQRRQRTSVQAEGSIRGAQRCTELCTDLSAPSRLSVH